MKKLFVLCLMFSVLTSFGQIIFQEDFDGVGGPTAGGAGTYTFPSGWLLANVDNLIPASAVSYINQAWERREDFANNVADSCAFSTSWYSPAASADDWMWTPAIGPLPGNCRLTWNAVAYDPANPDGYEVRIMTVAPTGYTGAIGNMVTSSTVIFSIPAEVSAWTARETSLSSYVGQTVYIGFRNNSADKFLLLIDDLVVEQVVSYDIALSSPNVASQYTMVPASLADSILFPGATILNNGLQTVHNVELSVNIKNELGTVVYTDSSMVDSLISATSVNLTTPAFSATATGQYYIHYSISMTEPDGNPVNDTLSVFGIEVSDSVYARDNGISVGALGIGSGTGGYLGQDFHLTKTSLLSSVGLYVMSGYTGTPLSVGIWSMTAGMPDSLIASTDTILYPDDSARYYILQMHTSNGDLYLNAGDYVFTAIEFDSTIQVGQAAQIFTIGHTWVNWPASPAGGWANMEYFGASFKRVSMLRANFSDVCSAFFPSVATTDASCVTCPDGSATVVLAGGLAPFQFSWSNGDTTQTVNNLLP
ncbi:MAG TPA: choice-of-anchor J domain-containing protein, partial [Bacteroidales bacterium]|nr:choice-of-anchor J domain-containing protein [Bacteroidales bacterium]